jgi:hypothetical protein
MEVNVAIYTYGIKSFNYESTVDLVSVKIEYTRRTSNSIQNRIWNWKGSHSAAQTQGLDNDSGASFSDRNLEVVTGIETKGEKIPVQVCNAIEEMEKKAFTEMQNQKNEKQDHIEKHEKENSAEEMEKEASKEINKEQI